VHGISAEIPTTESTPASADSGGGVATASYVTLNALRNPREIAQVSS
jgi:hypothetical protein